MKLKYILLLPIILLIIFFGTYKKKEIIPKEEQPKKINIYENKKLIAFTFDDGPSKNTSYLLDELDKRNAKVSFFVVGQMINNNKDTLKKAYEKGHTIGIHSYSHKNFKTLNKNQLLKEINNTNKLVSEITNEQPKYLRPPYGSYNKLTQKETNMPIILWSLDTLDWKKRNTELIYQEIINNVKEGDIILLHDLYKESIDATLKAMDYLEKQDYAFVSIDELINIKNINLEPHQVYTSFN